MADDLDDEERELLEKHRASKKAKQDKDEETEEVQLGFPDGSSFVGSFRRARSVAKARGYKLEPDPEPEEPADDGSDDKPKGVRAFQRRVS